MKNFIIPAEDIKQLYSGEGLCIIPDTILVEGKPLRHFYRIMPSHRQDSGWRFFCGTETDTYLSIPKYNGLYELNIIANYFPEIIQYLDSPPYTAYELSDDGHWVDVTLSTDWTELA